MKTWRICIPFALALLALWALAAILTPAQAAPGELATGDVVVPLGERQTNRQAAYRAALTHLYGGGRLHWAASSNTVSPTVHPGDLLLPVGESWSCAPLGGCDSEVVSDTAPFAQAYSLRPGGVAVLRSSVMVSTSDGGEAVAMWELAQIRQALDGYLLHALPYRVLTETEVAAGLDGYDLLIVPAFRSDARAEVLAALQDSGALAAIQAFVENGGTLYVQGSGFWIADAAGLLPDGALTDQAIELAPPDDWDSRGRMQIADPTSPLAWSWVTDTIYILDDPVLQLPPAGGGTEGGIEVIAVLTNATAPEPIPAVVRVQVKAGQVLGVVGHPTDAAHRLELPLFMDAVLAAMAGRGELWGDAVQTLNPAYPPHEFPAYEVVPVSATLLGGNWWDEMLADAVVTETVSAGYTVLDHTVSPAYTDLFTTADGRTVIVWQLGDLAPHALVTLTYQAETEPTALAAGVGTFSRGTLAYTDLSAKRVTVSHRPFVLTAKMAARLVGDRDLEADRHFKIPAEGLYLDIAMPLENKEQTLAHSLVFTDWVYLIYPIVDVENQHIILHTNDGETVWMRNEPFLWGEQYPLWESATSPTQTLTLADWQGDWCVFTSTFGIHTDPPGGLGALDKIDYGSFVTIPPTYTNVITVVDNELLLPCLPLTFDLGDFPGYWYEEPAVRYGIHSRELFSREVVFHGTPREGALVIEYDAGSVYVNAGADPVPFRQYLEAATPYAAQAPAVSALTYQDVWSRTYTTTMRASFYDVWDWDSCASCGGPDLDQHAGVNLTFGLWADLDEDGEYDTPVREIPTRLERTRMVLLGKTYSVDPNDTGVTIPAGQNLIELPIFKGLGVQIRPENEDWYASWRSVGPGHSELISVSEQTAYDHLFFQQDIPLGSWAAFEVSSTISTYPFNREGHFKLHDGARLIYRQMAAGPNRYEVYDSHVHAAEGLSSDGAVSKQVGPTAVSVYSDTMFFIYNARDLYDARAFDEDPYLKSWGYGDFVATTYVGGREGKVLFHTTVGPDGRTRVRVALDNNTGLTLTNLNVALDLPAGITATLLYTDPLTAPEPIWAELSFLNRTDVPDAWRSVWYFDLEIGNIDETLWGTVIEIPVILTAGNLPAGYEAPPARLALQRPADPTPTFVYGPAHSLTLTDTLPAYVQIEAVKWITDPATLLALQNAMDHDAGHVLSDTAGALFSTLPLTVSVTMDGDVAVFDLPQELTHLPPAYNPFYIVAQARLIRARHGPNVVNEGPTITYIDPFGKQWTEHGPGATVEAHGATVWADYACLGGSSEVEEVNGECTIPNSQPSTVQIRVTVFNEGDAIAQSVTATHSLPTGVEVISASGRYTVTDQAVIWNVGDLAPGASKRIVLELEVNPLQAEEPSGWMVAQATAGRVLVVRRTDGEFMDSYSNLHITGQIGDTFALHLKPGTWRVHLPVVVNNYLSAPDLIVEAIQVVGSDIRVTIKNQGNAAVTDEFWVDLYIDPRAAPAAPNQVWQFLGEQGLAWGVTQPLAPGESLTLNAAQADPAQSKFSGSLPAGTVLYAQVDSAHAGTTYGGVLESHEITGGVYNNVLGPVISASSIAVEFAEQATAQTNTLPPRP
ncbi:MAG: hypothetical protein JW934_05895 [Anaerolineae bacterium]|nr:hypothetical protein [Anaerolineae bacterium]